MKENKYEIARILSARTFELAVGAKPNVNPNPTDRFEEVAKKEMEKGVIPLKVYKTKK